MTIALFGYSHFTRECARALQDNGFAVALFCPRNDEPLFREADMPSLNLPVTWFEGMEDAALTNALDALRPEFILSIIFNHAIPESITRKARKAALNVHPAPLPQMRTATVWFWPLRLGLTQSEICVHHLNPQMDGGPVILRFPFSLGLNDTQGTHAAKLTRLAPRLMKTLAPVLNSEPFPEGEPQAAGTWYPPVRETDLWIDFTEPSESIRNLVRACNPFHPARTAFRSLTLGIHEIECPDSSPPSTQPGELLVGKDGLWVSCGDRAARLTVVAVPGEGVFSAERFVALYRVENGERLVSG